MRVEILDEAQQDLIEGYHFYEGQREGLGDYFQIRFLPTSTRLLSKRLFSLPS